jgi:hypothetical protein
MIDQDVRLSQLYVAPTGSPVPNNAPNSADTPILSFDLIITIERGDEVRGSYDLRYDSCDLTTCSPAPFHATFNQEFDDPKLWKQIPPPLGSTQEDFISVQTYTIPLKDVERTLSGHILQFTASLVASDGDIASFLVSEPFILV